MELVPRFSPKVDIMVLYSEEAYSLDGSGLTKEELRNNIGAAFGNTQTAMDKSLIDLDINIVFLGKVSLGVKQARPGDGVSAGREGRERCAVAFVEWPKYCGSQCRWEILRKKSHKCALLQ